MRKIASAVFTRAVTSILLVAAALALSACGHTEAAPPAIPMNVVMQTIRDYGRGRAGHPAPPVSDLPDTSEATYREHVRSLLMEGNYAKLEAIAQTNRTERGRFLAGNWRNNDFFNAVVWRDNDSDPKDADYQHQFEKLQKWQAARPQSAAARITLAKLYVYYADFARGDGYANTVSNS